MHWEKSFHNLQFDQQNATDNQVNAQIRAIELAALVPNLHRFLGLELQTGNRQLMLKASLINRLEKPGPQRSVDFDSTTDNFSRKLVEFHSLFFVSFVPSWWIF